MENYNYLFEISEELVAAWLDGNLSSEEDAAFVDLLSSDIQLGEIMDAYDDIETEFENLIEDGYEIPEELNIDFQLPSIDIISENELLTAHQYSSFEYTEEEEALDSLENYKGVCDSNEFYEDPDDMQGDELDIF